MGIINAIIFTIVFIISLSFHEFAHAFIAYGRGDDTPFYEGRVTLNPLKHIDILGTVIFPIILIISGSKFLFGWAKPVKVNPLNLKNPVKDFVLVAIAGPLANVFLYIVGIIILILVKGIYGHINNNLCEVCIMILYIFAFYLAAINIILFFFNMIPVPPLDGSRLLLLLPISDKHYKILQYIGIIILITLIFTGKIGYFLQILIDYLIP